MAIPWCMCRSLVAWLERRIREARGQRSVTYSSLRDKGLYAYVALREPSKRCTTQFNINDILLVLAARWPIDWVPHDWRTIQTSPKWKAYDLKELIERWNYNDHFVMSAIRKSRHSCCSAEGERSWQPERKKKNKKMKKEKKSGSRRRMCRGRAVQLCLIYVL